MKKIILFLLILGSIPSFSQDMTKFKLYKPEENAEKELEHAVKEAKKTNRFVFVQIGGNWCVWCARFNDFVSADKSIDSLIQANFIVYHMNYSQENKNEKLLGKYRFPQRFGFPVFLVIDGEGKLLHTQNSEYLEEGKSYNRNKVMEFFRNWTPAALDASSYK
jgi:thioredoxin-related protein